MTLHRGPVGPIAWALLSQTIWLPLLAIDLHDRWQARVRVEQEIAVAAARVRPPAAAALASAAAIETSRDRGGPSASASQAGTGILLGTASQALESAHQSLRSGERHLASRLSGLLLPSSARQPERQASPASPSPLRLDPQNNALLAAGFRRSELIGGTLSLADLQKPAMPSLALAEHARWATTGDPLAPLPLLWREPMRKALQALPSGPVGTAKLQSARVVHVPSSRVRSSTTVPLALQPDGSVDVLSRTDDPAVLEEVRHWSRTQASASRGGTTATLLHLEPLPVNPPVIVPGRFLSSPEPRSASPATPAASLPLKAPASRVAPPTTPTASAAGSMAPLPAPNAAPTPPPQPAPAQPVALQAPAVAPSPAAAAPPAAASAASVEAAAPAPAASAP